MGKKIPIPSGTNYRKPIPVMDETDYVRFWSRVELKANSDLCWIWKGSIKSSSDPYGSFTKGLNYTASRVAYFITTGKDPLQMCVLHTCDNPRCVNPNHLFLGTNHENVLDKVRKGRYCKSGDVKHPFSKKVGKYLNGTLVKEYNSMNSAKFDGHSQQSISRAVETGIKHHGYNWKLLE